MLDYESINELILDYQTTKNEILFNKAYRAVTQDWTSKIKQLSSRYKLDKQDVEEMMNTKFFLIARKYCKEKGNFIHMLNLAISRGCIDLVRKKIRRDNIEYLLTDDSDDEGNEINPLEKVADEDYCEYLHSFVQKKYEQRQLFASLLDLADVTTRQCLSALSETGSYQAAAKQLGTTRKTVRRRVTALSHKYNEKRFGEIHDYFTTATVKIAN